MAEMTPEEFRKYGYRVVDWIADYRARAGKLPVMSQVHPGQVKGQLPTEPPVTGEPFDLVFNDLDKIIMPGLSHWQHPNFFGYFPANASLASVLGDYLSTGLAVLGLSWQSSPALTEVEEVVTDWMRQMMDLSSHWSGVIQDTASSGTLVALLCARQKATQYALNDKGLQSAEHPLIVYATSHSHSSVQKAAMLAGFGKSNLRVIDHDTRYSMRPDALGAAIEQDRAAGAIPAAIVATAGTTTTMAFDPIDAIAKIARANGIWLHVDAAMAGSAMILPECRPLWNGVEEADSLIVNAHKWLGAVFDCSLYFVRDPQHLTRVMSSNPSYLQSSADGQIKNLRDWGIPLGRRFRALKLWILIREQGVAALQTRLRRDIENAKWFAEQAQATPGWRILAPVPLQTVCVRHEPEGLSGDALDRHTLAWVDWINRSGSAYLTAAILDGRWMARVSIGAIPTEREHVAALWRLMQDAATINPR